MRCKKVGKSEFLIEVLYGDDIIDSKLATDIHQKAKFISELSYDYNVIDIEYMDTSFKTARYNGNIGTDNTIY